MAIQRNSASVYKPELVELDPTPWRTAPTFWCFSLCSFPVLSGFSTSKAMCIKESKLGPPPLRVPFPSPWWCVDSSPVTVAAQRPLKGALAPFSRHLYFFSRIPDYTESMAPQFPTFFSLAPSFLTPTYSAPSPEKYKPFFSAFLKLRFAGSSSNEARCFVKIVFPTMAYLPFAPSRNSGLDGQSRRDGKVTSRGRHIAPLLGATHSFLRLKNPAATSDCSVVGATYQSGDRLSLSLESWWVGYFAASRPLSAASWCVFLLPRCCVSISPVSPLSSGARFRFHNLLKANDCRLVRCAAPPPAKAPFMIVSPLVGFFFRSFLLVGVFPLRRYPGWPARLEPFRDSPLSKER